MIPAASRFTNPLRAVEQMDHVSPTMRGVCLVIVAGAFFATMHGSVRMLSGELDAMEIAFFRAFFGFLYFAPLLLRTRLGVLRTRRLTLHIVRGAFNGASLLLWFTALSMVPLAHATSLSLTGPLFVVVGAILFLGERMSPARWAALAVGLLGALVIERPGIKEVEIGAILVLVSMLFVTCSKLIAKELSRTDESTTIVAYLSLSMMIPSGIALFFVWETPTLLQLGFMVLIGFLGSTGHLLLTTAYRIADISAVEPVVFSRLVWAALVGYLMFGELPEIWVWIGGALIVTASSLIARHESRQRRRARAAAEKETAPAE